MYPRLSKLKARTNNLKQERNLKETRRESLKLESRKHEMNLEDLVRSEESISFLLFSSLFFLFFSFLLLLFFSFLLLSSPLSSSAL